MSVAEATEWVNFRSMAKDPQITVRVYSKIGNLIYENGGTKEEIDAEITRRFKNCQATKIVNAEGRRYAFLLK